MTRSLEEIHGRLVAAIEGLVSSDEWKAMLEVSAHFHNYSFNNQLLIYLQCPEATRVAGYRAWQRLGRQVRKGERGIKILAPCRRRVSPVDVEVEQEEAERIEVLTGFRVVHVFDLRQTEGDEIADVRPRRLTGEVPQQLIDQLQQRIADEGFTLRLANIRKVERKGTRPDKRGRHRPGSAAPRLFERGPKPMTSLISGCPAPGPTLPA